VAQDRGRAFEAIRAPPACVEDDIDRFHRRPRVVASIDDLVGAEGAGVSASDVVAST